MAEDNYMPPRQPGEQKGECELSPQLKLLGALALRHLIVGYPAKQLFITEVIRRLREDGKYNTILGKTFARQNEKINEHTN